MKKRMLFLLQLFVFLLCIAGTALGQQPGFSFLNGEILYDTSNRFVSVLVNDNRGFEAPSVQSASMILNGTTLTDVEYSLLTDTRYPITYCFVVDTSPTSLLNQKEIASNIANMLYHGREGHSGDNYILITYSEHVAQPRETENPAMLFGSIEYDSGPKAAGDYTAALDTAIQALNKDNTFGLKVIILITDGRQTSSPLYNSEAMSSKLQEYGYPVYAIGLSQSEVDDYVEKDLKELEKISQVSGGLYLKPEDSKKDAYDGIAADIQRDLAQVAVVSGRIPDAYSANGGTYGLIVSLQGKNEKPLADMETNVTVGAISGIPTATPGSSSSSGENSNGGVVTIASPTPASTVTATPTLTPTPKFPENVIKEVEKQLKKSFGAQWKIFIGVCLLSILLLLLLLLRRPGKKPDNLPPDDVNLVDPPITDDRTDTTQTVTTGTDYWPPVQPVSPVQPCAHVILTNKRTTGACDIDIAEGEKAIFGRTANAALSIHGLNANDTVSHKHFSLLFDAGVLKLQDEASKNGTYLNGKEVQNIVRVSSGDTIMAGQEEFLVVYSVNYQSGGDFIPRNSASEETQLV